MALRNILSEHDELLRKISKPVEKITPTILTLLDDMAETLDAADGVGLAAPQVGILRRIALVRVPDDDILYELINPRILEASGEQEKMEGCLSIDGIAGVVKRPAYLKVWAQNRSLEAFELEAEGLLAIAIEHEIDHLDGILYTDKAYNIMRTSSQEYKDYVEEEERREDAEKLEKRRAWRASRRKRVG
ncbi:MAG: peptide deformylase [Defluviitaleaceae bacterium]|nr:peptide deformylase [Defluviitaleaceae bacterium]